MEISREERIGEVVARNFQTARVFEELGLDFCCGGKKSIDKACEEKGLDENIVIERLSKLEETNSVSSHYNDWDIGFLSDYIINNHHSYVINSIPSIEHHLEKVIAAHGAKHPEVAKVNEIFLNIKKELMNHMAKEEMMLFPYIKKLNTAIGNSQVLDTPVFGSVSNPITVMEKEHQHAGDGIEEIKKLTNNYTPPKSACGTFKVLYNELKDFEKDLHIHVHLENNILFPKAIEQEREILKRTSNS